MSEKASLPLALRLQIFERDGWACQFCGESEREWLRVDHIIPVVKGGADEESNLWTLCLWCNAIKARRVMPFQMAFRKGCPVCGWYSPKRCAEWGHMTDTPTYQRFLRTAS